MPSPAQMVAATRQPALRQNFARDWQAMLAHGPVVALHPDDFSTDTWTDADGSIGGTYTEATNPPTKDTSTFSNTVLTFDNTELLTYSGTATDHSFLNTMSASYEVFAAVRLTDVASTDYVFSASTAANAGGAFLRLASGAPSVSTANTAGTAYYFVTHGTSVSADSNNCFRMSHTLSTSLGVAINGGSLTNDTSASGSAGEAVSSGIVIGGRGDGSASFRLEGHLGPLIMFNKAIPANIVQVCERICGNWFTIAQQR